MVLGIVTANDLQQRRPVGVSGVNHDAFATLSPIGYNYRHCQARCCSIEFIISLYFLSWRARHHQGAVHHPVNDAGHLAHARRAETRISNGLFQGSWNHMALFHSRLCAQTTLEGFCQLQTRRKNRTEGKVFTQLPWILTGNEHHHTVVAYLGRLLPPVNTFHVI